MSQASKINTAFWLSFCLALGACGGGGGSSSGGNNPGPESPEEPEEPEVPLEGAPTVQVDSSLKKLRLSWNVQEGDAYYIVSENPDGGSGFTEVARVEDSTEITFDIVPHLYDWNNAAYIVEACDANDECVPSLQVSPQEAMLNTIGYFKASNPDIGDEFGQMVALSDDGRTLAVGAHNEQSASTGINGDQTDNSVESAGAVYVFTLGDSGWVQEAYIKASDIASDDDFGHSIALSGDGNTLAVGAPWEENRTLHAEHDVGAVYVFSRVDGQWSEQGYLHAATVTTRMHFGVSVSLSDDGNTLAVGAPGEGGVNTEVTGVEGGSSSVAGSAYIFTRVDGVWTETAALTSSNLEVNDLFGYDIALSGDGSTLAVGAIQESSAATGVNGNEADNSAAHSGAVYIFGRGEGGWEQQAYLKASNTQAGALLGFAVAISGNGNVVAAGAKEENDDAGGVHVFTRTDATWAHQAHITSSNLQSGDNFGVDLALSDDGSLLAVGASWEDSTAQGMGGSQTSNPSPNSGAVYIFIQGDDGWSQKAYVKASNTQAQSHFGHSVTLDATGETMAVGAIWEDGGSTGVGGDQADQSVENSGAVYLY